MKFFESHFDEYIKTNLNNSLHSTKIVENNKFLKWII